MLSTYKSWSVNLHISNGNLNKRIMSFSTMQSSLPVTEVVAIKFRLVFVYEKKVVIKMR